MIDTHVHIGGEADGFTMNEEMVLYSMEKYNIDISIVSNGDSVEYGQDRKILPKEKQISQKQTLERIITFCRSNPGRIYGGFWCKPHHEILTEEIEKMIELVPNTTDAAGEKHVPVVEVNKNVVKVTVGEVIHPMTEAHLINFVVLETNNNLDKDVDTFDSKS